MTTPTPGQQADEREALIQRLRAAVQTYPQMSEDEPGGYLTEFDQLLDEAAAALAEPAAPVAVPEGLLNAALRWTYCPVQGGYQGGASIEDCCEVLTEEVVKLTGVQPGEEWISESEIPALAATPTPAQQAGSEAINPGSPEASAMIDSVLAEYGWPANPKNAARAGFVAATRMLAPPAPRPRPRNLEDGDGGCGG